VEEEAHEEAEAQAAKDAVSVQVDGSRAVWIRGIVEGMSKKLAIEYYS